MILAANSQPMRTIIPKIGLQELRRNICPVLNQSSCNAMSMTTSAGLENVYSSENRDKTIANLRNRVIGFESMANEFARKAAVLVPLCYDLSGQPAILYTLRSLNMNQHSGEISFPGGAADPEDEGNDLTTALRETEEELGISRESIDIWTSICPLPAKIPSLGVTPVIGFLNLGNIEPDKLKISPNEVEMAFTVTLEHLCNPNNWAQIRRRGIVMPTFKNLNIRHPKTAESDEPPDVPLWGLTAVITHFILEALVPELYTRRLPLFEGFIPSPPNPSSKM